MSQGFSADIFFGGAAHEKTIRLCECFFQLNPPVAGEIHLRWMKSLRDEIPLRGERRGGFDFIRAEICAANREDLTVRSTISFVFLIFLFFNWPAFGGRDPPSVDEIALRWDPASRGEERRIWFHLKPQAEDFIRAEIGAANREDLTVRSTISFRKAYGAAEIGVRRRVHLYYDLAKAVKDSDTLYSEIEKTESELR